jgi:hypothetical protein
MDLSSNPFDMGAASLEAPPLVDLALLLHGQLVRCKAERFSRIELLVVTVASPMTAQTGFIEQ